MSLLHIHQLLTVSAVRSNRASPGPILYRHSTRTAYSAWASAQVRTPWPVLASHVQRGNAARGARVLPCLFVDGFHSDHVAERLVPVTYDVKLQFQMIRHGVSLPLMPCDQVTPSREASWRDSTDMPGSDAAQLVHIKTRFEESGQNFANALTVALKCGAEIRHFVRMNLSPHLPGTGTLYVTPG